MAKGSTAKADRIMTALLACSTVRAAAATAKVSERTIYDYLQKPEFAARYRAAREDVLRGVEVGLRQHLTAAVGVLANVMNNAERDADRLRAAALVLDYNLRAVELQDVLERLRNLEVLLSDKD